MGSDLPLATSTFVGRTRELKDISRLLATSRLVTLVGAGGSGKTRLALEVARRSARRGSDLRIADLSQLQDPDLLVPFIARVINAPLAPQSGTLGGLESELSDRRLLLLIDNCEHVIAECARIAEAILAAAPGLRLLLTSRERLGISGEVVWSVPPLAEPEAAALFIERARERRPEFDTFGAGRGVIDEICRCLDYMPLAIELAASQVAMFSPDELLRRLDDRFALLRLSKRTSAARHHTLHATVDWSYDLLDPDERLLFRRLSVFVGGFDARAVEAAGGQNALGLLARLMDKSLVVSPRPAPVSRYAMLETLRSYGREKLEEAGELAEAQRLHLAYFVARAEDAFATRRVTGSAALLFELDADIDNLRAALGRSRDVDPCAGLRIVAATREVWFRMAQAEGLQWARAFLAQCAEDGIARAWALLAAGQLGFTQLQHAEARHDLKEAARAGAALGDTNLRAWAAWMLGVDSFLAEDFAAARAHLLGSLELHARTKDAIGRGLALGSLGTVQLRLGDHAAAVASLSEALALLEEASDTFGVGFCHTYLGIALADGGEPPQAAAHFRQALTVLAPIREVTMLTLCLIGMGQLASGSDWSRALRLAGAASALRDRSGGPFPRWIAASVRELHSAGSGAIGADAAEREWRAGAALGAERSVALALGAGGSATGSSPLSQREMDVARLIAEGLTNREAAERLGLSRRTIENHVLHISNKLALTNRTQIATWLVQRD